MFHCLMSALWNVVQHLLFSEGNTSCLYNIKKERNKLMYKLYIYAVSDKQ